MATNLEVFSTRSVEKLRATLLAEPVRSQQAGLDGLIDELELQLVPTSYQYEPSILSKLQNEASGASHSDDKKHCRVVFSALPGLTPANATDERLWVTLCAKYCSNYVNNRWPMPANDLDKQVSVIKNHWFASSVRGRLRDNAISRLWWTGMVAHRIPGWTDKAVLDVLLDTSEYASSLLGRNTSANSTIIVKAILQITKAAYDKGYKGERLKFRRFMSQVDLVGGRLNLAALSLPSVVSILEPLYREAFEIPEELGVNR